MLIRCQLIDDAAVCTKMLDAFFTTCRDTSEFGCFPAAFRAPRKFLEELRISPISAAAIFYVHVSLEHPLESPGFRLMKGWLLGRGLLQLPEDTPVNLGS